MNFFQTTEGRPHVLRAVGVIYLIALPLGCNYFRHMDLWCWTRIMGTAGWWLAFGDKRPLKTWPTAAEPGTLLGMILLLLAMAGGFYALG